MHAHLKLLKAHLYPLSEKKFELWHRQRSTTFFSIVLCVLAKLTCSSGWESPRGNKSMQKLFCPHHVWISWLGAMNTECGLWNTKCKLYNRPLLTTWQGRLSINTVGILYHSKWQNILAVSWILEMWMNQDGIFLFVIHNWNFWQVLKCHDGNCVCCQAMFPRHPQIQVVSHLAILNSLLKGQYMLQTRQCFLGIGSNHYRIRTYTVAQNIYCNELFNFKLLTRSNTIIQTSVTWRKKSDMFFSCPSVASFFFTCTFCRLLQLWNSYLQHYQSWKAKPNTRILTTRYLNLGVQRHPIFRFDNVSICLFMPLLT